jgi:cytochrome P450
VIRLESPIRGFSRLLTTATRIGDHGVPAGARVLLLFASANRDELRWHNADQFDITRHCNGQLGFGYGTHGCAARGLARLEGQSVLCALMEKAKLCGQDRPGSTPLQKWGRQPLSYDA